MVHEKNRVLVIGGQFTGLFCGRDLKKHFHVTIVDCKEFFEYTPGILRCYVKPAHFDSLSFTLQPVIERSMGIKFIWGEVLKLDGDNLTADVLPIYSQNAQRTVDTISFDYCLICSGCNFNPFSPIGESLWFPTVHEANRPKSEWGHIDERFIEGRRRHILEEYHKIAGLAAKKSTIMIAGAGFIGVEWATELEYYFPDLKMTIIDFLPRCLGPLPDSAAEYCSEYMSAVGIKEFYKLKYEPKNPDFWKAVELPGEADFTYVCMGVKASNYFMPEETLSLKGPGGGGWIHFNQFLQVTKKPEGADDVGEVWGKGKCFAVGDCNYGCIGNPPKPVNVELFKYTESENQQKPLLNKLAETLSVQKLDKAEIEWQGLIVKDKSGKPLSADDLSKIPSDAFPVSACLNAPLADGPPRPAKFEAGWIMPPIPKISYPGEEQALHACNNVEIMDKKRGCHTKMLPTWWPWGAGMFATSLGPHDACFVVAANDQPKSGSMVNWWLPGALQKEIIETTKVNECKNGIVGICIWHFVHHTPINLFGRGPWKPHSKAFGI